ncbi:MAG: alpha/beta hydrolase [Dehalococcoidia bacterium]
MQAVVSQRAGAAVHIDPSLPREHIVIRAADGVESWGMLYTPAGGRRRTAVHLMHPRGDMSRHYIVPGLVAAGYSVFAANSRYLNNDRDMVHERIVLDIAAGQQMLRERGFEAVALFGNSGGGSLFALYQSQAVSAAGERLRDIPGDWRLDLGAYDLPPGDAYISVASHPGQGLYLMRTLDPAVVDEGDPLLSDPALDMYDPANGYRPLPQASIYSAEFLSGYRAAQRARTARLDATAQAHLERQRAAREAMAAPDFERRPAAEQMALRRAAAADWVMVIYRTLANPAFLDPSIEPNQRPLGSIFAADPMVGNYAQGGLARVMTPRGWLSTWSGLSSRAVLARNIATITAPTLIVNALGDSDIFPPDAQDVFDASPATDKQLVALEEAGLYLTPVPGSTRPDPRERLIDLLVPWLRERLP